MNLAIYKKPQGKDKNTVEIRRILRVPAFQCVASSLRNRLKHTYKERTPCWLLFPSPDFGYCPKVHDMLGSMLISGGSSSKPNDHYCIEELEEEHNQNIQDIQIYSPSRHLSALLADLRSFLAVSVTAVKSLVGDSLYTQEPLSSERTKFKDTSSSRHS